MFVTSPYDFTIFSQNIICIFQILFFLFFPKDFPLSRSPYPLFIAVNKRCILKGQIISPSRNHNTHLPVRFNLFFLIFFPWFHFFPVILTWIMNISFSSSSSFLYKFKFLEDRVYVLFVLSFYTEPEDRLCPLKVFHKGLVDKLDRSTLINSKERIYSSPVHAGAQWLSSFTECMATWYFLPGKRHFDLRA